MAERAYPPSARGVLAVLLQWLEKEDLGSYVVTAQPDKEERNAKACDYVCVEQRSGTRIAVEVTSTWRGDAAGAEDAHWARWTRDVAHVAKGRIVGEYSVTTPIAIPKGCDSARFAGALLDALSRTEWPGEDRLVPVTVDGLELSVSRHGASGSEIEFVRFAPIEFEMAALEFLSSLSERKCSQLEKWKPQGVTTYLLVYNTYWPLMSPWDMRQLVARVDSTISRVVDHLVVVSGNPPDDAWCDRIDLPRG
jgi:hypothetical protein